MRIRGVLFALALLGWLICGQNLVAASLNNWHWRNPLPNGNPQAGPHTLYSVVFGNGIFAGVGDSGVVSISSDATNWTEYATTTTNKLNGIAYVNGIFLTVGD